MSVCAYIHTDCCTELMSLLLKEGKDTEAPVVAQSLPVVSEGWDKQFSVPTQHPFFHYFPDKDFSSLQHKRPRDTEREAEQQARCLSAP